jgi:hypothetical protein
MAPPLRSEDDDDDEDGGNREVDDMTGDVEVPILLEATDAALVVELLLLPPPY